jgi:hypothetical protein
VDHSTAVALALVTVALAIASALGAVVTVIGTRQARRDLRGRAAASTELVSRVQTRAAELGRTIEALTDETARLAAAGRAVDARLLATVDVLAATHTAIIRFRRSALDPARRLLGFVGMLGRIALMWRTPAR